MVSEKESSLCWHTLWCVLRSFGLSQTEVEDTLSRIKDHRGVEAVMIVNKDGIPIRPPKGLRDSDSRKYASHVIELAQKARSMVRDIDPEVCLHFSHSLSHFTLTLVSVLLSIQDDLTFLRIRSQKHEILVAPDKEFTLIVIQNPAADEK